VLVKDLTPVKMMLCTHGSPLHRTTIPAKNHPMIDTLEEHGGIVYGKSNTPEFGAGSQTFNSLFGVTATPHDITKTAGGSRCVCVCVVCVCCVCVLFVCDVLCVCVCIPPLHAISAGLIIYLHLISGGAAASLSSQTSWLATGTDLGGSLRIPAAFCGVVGLRPSPALVPQEPVINILH
jgi:amidase